MIKMNNGLRRFKGIGGLPSKKREEIMKKYGLKEGRYLGQKLKEKEYIWLNNIFKICVKDIKKLLITCRLILLPLVSNEQDL